MLQNVLGDLSCLATPRISRDDGHSAALHLGHDSSLVLIDRQGFRGINRLTDCGLELLRSVANIRLLISIKVRSLLLMTFKVSFVIAVILIPPT